MLRGASRTNVLRSIARANTSIDVSHGLRTASHQRRRSLQIGLLDPKINDPRSTFQTSSFNALTSLAVHHTDRSISSAFFQILIAATLRALTDAFRRGSEWSVKIATVVRAGGDV